MAKSETISDIIYDSWFDVATRKYGHVTAIEQVISDNPAIWLPVTKFGGNYIALVQQDFQAQKPNIR